MGGRLVFARSRCGHPNYLVSGIFKSVISSSHGDSDDDMTLLKIWRNAVYASQTKILEGPSS